MAELGTIKTIKRQAVPANDEVNITFQEGECLFYEGEPSDYAYLILEGTLTLTKETGRGQVQLQSLHAGDLVGEMGIIDGNERSASAIAATEVKAQKFDIHSFMRRMEKDTDFSLSVVNRLIGHLRNTNDRLAHQFFLTTQLAEETNANKNVNAWNPLSWIDRFRDFFGGVNDFAEFQPDATEIENKRFPPAAKAVLYLIVGFFFAVIIWSSIAEIDNAVIAPGQITTKIPNIVVQSFETAMIVGIHVKEGDVIEAGQELATLDATFAEADVQASKSTFTSVVAQERRLIAELTGKIPEQFSSDVAVDRLQRDIFTRRQAELTATLSSWDGRQQQLASDIQSNVQDVRDIRQQVEVLRELEAMRASLLKTGHGSRVNYLAAKNQRLSMEREGRRLSNLRVRLQHEVGAVDADRKAFVSEWRSAIGKELVTTRREREELSEKLKKMERRESMVSLHAPARGTILSIADRSVGSVIQQAETMFTIVPADVPLVMEADIQPKDVGQIKVGDSVRVKLDALPFQKYGILEGTVKLISEDTVEAESAGDGGPTYQTKIELNKNNLRNVPADFRLIPGMSGTAEITVGRKRVITYFFYPIAKAFDQSFKEP